MQNKIFTISASDRNNYGDLLFPLVVEKAAQHLNVSGDFYHAAVIENDLSDFGARKTISHRNYTEQLRAAQTTSAPHQVIFAGGEVMSST